MTSSPAPSFLTRACLPPLLVVLVFGMDEAMLSVSSVVTDEPIVRVAPDSTLKATLAPRSRKRKPPAAAVGTW